ncbi:PH domain-containing protein [Citricoccus sp. GCM10030269]|uniref:PH domain-containing protein n=1 Tax=Citricoccus sp. GCM10030269 TaxID=3273388 RepID=UPI003619FE91
MGLKLAPGEQVRVRTRAHPRALAGPVIRLLLIALVTGYAQGFLARSSLPDLLADARHWLVWAVGVLAALAVLFGCVRPAWRWLFRRTILTTRRIIQRAGLGKSRERTLHLLAIYDVRLRQRRGQKMARAGDVVVDHGSGSQWVLANMPEAARFRELIVAEMAALRRDIAAQAQPYQGSESSETYQPAQHHQPAQPGPSMRGGHHG